MKVVYVDFCNTLCRGYSLNNFLKFLAKRSGFHYIFILYILKSIGRIFHKKSLQNYFIRFFSNSYLEDVSTEYAKILERNFIHSSINLVSNLYKNNYRVVIVSAAFSNYIEKIRFLFKLKKLLLYLLKIIQLKLFTVKLKYQKFYRWSHCL